MLVSLHVLRKQAIFQCHINFSHLIDSSWLMEIFRFHPSLCLQGQDNWKKMFSEKVMQVVLKKIVKLIMFSCLSCVSDVFLSLLEAGFRSSNVTIMDEL